MPGMVKVGHTFDDPRERANQLSNSTSVPSPFVVVFALQTKYPELVEGGVHRIHREKRVSTNREFFFSELQIPCGENEKRIATEDEENEWWIEGIKSAARMLPFWIQWKRADAKYKRVVALCNWRDKELMHKFQLQPGGVR